MSYSSHFEGQTKQNNKKVATDLQVIIGHASIIDLNEGCKQKIQSPPSLCGPLHIGVEVRPNLVPPLKGLLDSQQNCAAVL